MDEQRMGEHMEIGKVLIFAEMHGGKVLKAAYELLTKARSVFSCGNVKIGFAVFGDDIRNAIQELSSSGADFVFGMESSKLALFNVDYFSLAMMEAVKAWDPDVLMIPATSSGEELAPTLGVRLHTGVAAHCVDFELREDGSFVQMVPAFGGKVIGEILIPDRKPQIATVKPGIFQAEPQSPGRCDAIMLDNSHVEDFSSKIKALRILEKEMSGQPLEKAPVVVCGGYGLGSKEIWEKIELLASRLGGAAGCTRPVVDEGWSADEDSMIGTSGKTIRPKVYIGFGVSGAAHHVCGMKDAGIVISVNNDEQSDMFQVSDYKVVGDLKGILDELLMQCTARQA